MARRNEVRHRPSKVVDYALRLARATRADDPTPLPVLRHRVLLNFTAEADGLDADQIVSRLLEAVPPR